MNLQNDGLSVQWYLRPKPVGKVKRRVQEMRYHSTQMATIDLSHNESARFATDALMNQGLRAYQEVLAQEGEVDHLSKEEKFYILGNTKDPEPPDAKEQEKDQEVTTACSDSSQTYFPAMSESEPPILDYGWPVADWSYHLQGMPSVEVFFQSDREICMKDTQREFIRKATTVLAIVMDIFSDVEMFCDVLEATRKRNVSVYLLLDQMNLHVFMDMCENLQINNSHLTKMSVRSIAGETYCAKSGRKFTGQIKEKFIIADCTQVLVSSYSFTWLSWQVNRGLAMLIKGCGVKPFDLEFRRLYAISKPVPGFPTKTDSLNLNQPLISEQLQTVHSDHLDNPHAQSTALPTDQRALGPTHLTGTANNQQNFSMGLPSSHWLPQRHTTRWPIIRQRSFSKDYDSGTFLRRPVNLYPHTYGAPGLAGTLFSATK
ncbi:protein FAM83A [Chanos chanos]|uniref:Protein FAM83A n=1 Tax=Chanos chanos TaxID=29144 RepID=A0A6J2W6K7_CHACN|nr:protein FAM83A [Chanos chanos]